MISWTLPKEASPGLETTFAAASNTSPEAQDISARIESVDNAGSPRNFLDTSLTITSPTGLAKSVSAVQQSPGLYGGVIKGLNQGVYEVQVEQHEAVSGKLMASQVTGLVVPYPSEYRLSADSAQAAKDLLTDLAQLGAGKSLAITQPAAAFTHDIASQPRPMSLWPWLLAMAIALFPLDVAVRRLTITRADIRVARAILRRRTL
jgi:hypothetical protein